MIFVRDAGDHIAYGTVNACVDRRVDYLVRGHRAAGAVCAGLPLPLDERVYPVGGAGPRP